MVKLFIWLGLFVGSTVGGLIPELWGAGIFSFFSVMLSTLGGVAGIFIGYKLGKMIS
jgi:hypothetical protein